MASLEELSTALVNADKAGDVEAARILASEIVRQRKSPSLAETATKPGGEAAPSRGVWDQLSGQTGPRYQLWPERMARGLVSSVATLPQRAGEEAVKKSTGEDYSMGPFVEAAALTLPVNPAVRSGDRAFPGASQALVPNKPVVPTTRELYDAGVKDLNAARGSGLEVTADSVSRLSQNIQRQLYESGIHPVDAPATFAKLKTLESAPPGAFATASNLKSLRDSFGATAQNFNPQAAKDQLAATRSIKQLDEFIPSLAPADVLAGTPATTANLFKRGRDNVSAAMRSNDITGNLDKAVTGILERAELRAQTTHSGRNIDNAIRQRLASTLQKEKELSGFSEKEIAGLTKAAEGGPVRNTSRYIANLLGGGGGIGQSGLSLLSAAGGAVAGSPFGPVGSGIGAAAGAAGVAGVGSVARFLANQLAKRHLGKVDEQVRTRAPLYEERMLEAGASAPNASTRSAIIRMLAEAQQESR